MTYPFSALTPAAFPATPIRAIADEMRKIDITDLANKVSVVLRPLNVTDPSFSIGVFADTQTPVLDSYEFGPTWDPTLERYMVNLHVLVKATSEETGLTMHSAFSTAVRSILGGSDAIRLALGGLTTTQFGVTKRLKRWGVQSTKYASQSLAGQHLYLSVIELMIEVESING